MDLIDGPPSDPTPSSSPLAPSESRMRRFGKILVLTAACSAALVLTIRHGGDGIRVGAESPLPAATPGIGRYDLSRIPNFSKTVMLVRENYFAKNPSDPKRTL